MAVGFRRDLSLNALLSDLATRAMLLEVPESSSTTVGARLASSVMDLASAIIDSEIEGQGALNRQRMSQLERAQRYAIANLGDENLVARGNGKAWCRLSPNVEQVIHESWHDAHALGMATSA